MRSDLEARGLPGSALVLLIVHEHLEAWSLGGRARVGCWGVGEHLEP